MYRLECKTCKTKFDPMVCTESGELLCPDYDACEQDAGCMNAERLRDFHDAHSDCELVEVEI